MKLRAIAAICLAGLLLVVGAVHIRAQDRGAEKIISANERAYIDALLKKKLAGFTAVVSRESWVISESGRSSTAEFIKNFDQVMAATKQGTVSITDEAFQWINATTVIHTFKATSKGGTFDGKSMDGSSWNSTVWVKQGEKWMNMFTQSSRIPPDGAK